ncbi:ASCH domain-containing protein [Butyrivibrio sp. AE3004]|uniref:ASCH domain-containing protein n=1 Tax=Butyrivibrio sp. AE3004 TaxID=1506994 RepID=UPI0004944FD2|nr:ASCH domain-containing protein [Butyrivibrio sp. AE3004]
MKALSVHPYYAMAIISGRKTIEIRSWDTAYRGDILICSTAKKQRGCISSHALGVVTLKDIRRFDRGDCEGSLLPPEDYVYHYFVDYAWVLENPRPIIPFEIKGKLSLWNYDGDIDIIPESDWKPAIVYDEDAEQYVGKFFDKYWKPLLY